MDTRSYLVIGDTDSTHYSFKHDLDGNLINHKILSPEMFIDIYQDSVLYYCNSSKIYCTTVGENMITDYIAGNWYSSLLLNHLNGFGLSPEENHKSVESYIGGNKVLSESKTIVQGESIYYCEYRSINHIVDSSCFSLYFVKDFEFKINGYKKVTTQYFRRNCYALKRDSIDVLDYIANHSSLINKKYLLIDFFTYYCKPCIEAIPRLNFINNSDSIQVVGIHPLLEEPSKLKEYKERFDCDYILLGSNSKFYDRKHMVTSFPYYVLIDNEKNKIIKTWEGAKINLDDLIKAK